MTEENPQTKIWQGKFGDEYSDRVNYHKNMDKVYLEQYGITRTDMNKLFLDTLFRNIKILEVGCNIGNQLLILKKMGFTNLFGRDINHYSIEIAQKALPSADILYGDVFDMANEWHYYDMVFTSNVLIHIPPERLDHALNEIYRSTLRYIWGFEYYSPEHQEIEYRGHKNLLWKGDFVKEYLKRFPLKLIKRQKFKYLKNDNIDEMFLLEKQG